jgi:uncharacterized coiled-coil protein SlyX
MADEKMELRIRALEEKVAVQARELERLKKQPAAPVTAAGTAERTLGEAEYSVHVDQEKGTIGGE